MTQETPSELTPNKQAALDALKRHQDLLNHMGVIEGSAADEDMKLIRTFITADLTPEKPVDDAEVRDAVKFFGELREHFQYLKAIEAKGTLTPTGEHDLRECERIIPHAKTLIRAATATKQSDKDLRDALKDVLKAICSDRHAVQDTLWVNGTPVGDFIMCALDEELDLDELQNAPYLCTKTADMFAEKLADALDSCLKELWADRHSNMSEEQFKRELTPEHEALAAYESSKSSTTKQGGE